MPLNGVTGRMFGVAHRLFLCAHYEVRPVQNPQAVTPYLAPLLPRWNAAQKPLQSLRVYFRTTCKLDV